VAAQLSVLDLASAHQEALVEVLADAREKDGAERVVRAGGEFFLESLSSLEMVQRVLREARETALVERRQATILRQLSTFLADTSIALDTAGSLEEMPQLVAEHALEVIGAASCSVRIEFEGDEIEAAAGDKPPLGPAELVTVYATLRPSGGALRISRAELGANPALRAVARPGADSALPCGWLAAALTALDGRQLGLIQLFDKLPGDFSELDEAILVQLAQMASAAVERAQLYHSTR
jgi:hypothetical protein